MKIWTIKISIVALITHVFLIYVHIVMNQLDRNVADAIENPFDGWEDTYDGIIGYLDQVCISKDPQQECQIMILCTPCADMT